MGKNDKDKARLHAFGQDNPELSAYTRNKLRKDFGKLKQHKNETIEVTLQKELAREMIMSCYPYNTIIMYLECCYGLSHDTAKNRVSTAAQEFILSEQFKDWKNMNLMRLDNILYKTYEAGKYGDAIKAIDTQNKMVGAYAPTQLEVTQCNAIF